MKPETDVLIPGQFVQDKGVSRRNFNGKRPDRARPLCRIEPCGL